MTHSDEYLNARDEAIEALAYATERLNREMQYYVGTKVIADVPEYAQTVTAYAQAMKLLLDLMKEQEGEDYEECD